MDIDAVCDCLQQAVEYYRENADTFIEDGWYNVSFRVRIDAKHQEATPVFTRIVKVGFDDSN